MPERRKMERFPLALEASVSSVDEIEAQADDFFTKDICAGGAFIKTKKQLPVGTDVKIDLVLSLHKLKHLSAKKSHVTIRGAVIRTNETGMAVCFGNYKIFPAGIEGTVSPSN